MHPINFTMILALATTVTCANFPFEAEVLTDIDIAAFPDIAFGDISSPSISDHDKRPCRAHPSTPDWPTLADWHRINDSLRGVLLKPAPAASACYADCDAEREKCEWLRTEAGQTRFWLNDPINMFTEWTVGNSCGFPRRGGDGEERECRQGGYPVYVVNATTVRHVQIAMNFARRRNLRLVIKNTGHDFVGKSAGFGALSIWTHHLKSFEFVPQYTVGQGDERYTGMAARVGAGLESWEMYVHMEKHNMTLVVPNGYSVGAFGGWTAGGGHSNLASLYGLGSDQVLSFQVVTADGRFVTAELGKNEDLFWASRGGGTYGVITSAIIKAYPPIPVTLSSLNFTSANSPDLETFWAAVNTYFHYSSHLCDLGGTTYNYITNINGFYTFTNDFELPSMTAQHTLDALQPLFDTINDMGIPVVNPQPTTSLRSSSGSNGVGMASSSGLWFASRLFPRANWDDEELYVDTMGAVREIVEAGYTFHGIHMTPTEAIAGWPGADSGVNPAFRKTVMYADVWMGDVTAGAPAEEVLRNHARFNGYMDRIRNVTRVGGGAYVNEADVLEPDWQRGFWGKKYKRSLMIKRQRDPWGLFWAPTTVGSEKWTVRTKDEPPTQDGPLCRVER